MAVAARLAEPPRAVPLSLQIRLLAAQGITDTSPYLFIAAVMLGGAMYATFTVRVTLVFIGGVLAAFALLAIVSGALRTVARLRSMREGYLSAGRIAVCRFTWEDRKVERPYREFLENWTVEYGRSTTGKMMGCASMTIILLVAVPFGLGTLAVLGIAVYAVLTEPGRPDLDGMLIAKIAAGGVLFVAALLWLLRSRKREVMDEVEGYMQWRKLRCPGDDDQYDDEARALMAEAKARGVQVSLKEPLPDDPAGIELVCKVEYAIAGRPRAATARAPLCSRLDPAGVERLLFMPTRPKHVELLAALPPDADTDEHGRWQPVAAGSTALFLAVTAALAIAALALLCWNIAELVHHGR